MRPRCGLAAGFDQAGHNGGGQNSRDDPQRPSSADLRHPATEIMRPVQDQLQADERQNQRQPARQVHQPVEQAGHQEEQGPRAQQCECVGDQDDVALISDAEDGRDRVQREHDVRAADGDENDEQRRDDAPPVDPGDQPASGVGIAERQYPAKRLNQCVVLDVGVLVPVPVQPDRGPQQYQAEDQEHQRKQRQQGCAQGHVSDMSKNSDPAGSSGTSSPRHRTESVIPWPTGHSHAAWR